MKQQILVVSHCFLNDSVKLRGQNPQMQAQERDYKRAFIKQMLGQGIELIQLPCPEFLIYGGNRWGHAASQFDTPHFRREVRRMLGPVVMQLSEYSSHPDRYEILGILGIDGSPSCGVNYTYDGEWGGELTDNAALPGILNTLQRVDRPGIFIEELKNMLRENNLLINLYSLETFASVTTDPIRRDASQVDIPIYAQNHKGKDAGGDNLAGLDIL